MPCTGFGFVAGMLTLGGLKDDYSVFSPLTGLRGRNGALSLKSRWRALWAIGVKVVSSRSTLSGFWVDLGLLGLLGGSGPYRVGSVLLYICNAIGSSVLLYIWMAGDALGFLWPLAGLLAVGLARGLRLF